MANTLSQELVNILNDFPQLNGRLPECRELGPPTPLYNCIAWSLGLETLWIDPPENIRTFIALYGCFGLKECEKDDALVDGYYSTQERCCTHASRQSIEFGWTSKLGSAHKISHPREGLSASPLYGDISVHFRSTTAQNIAASLNDGGRRVQPLSPKEHELVRELAESLRQASPALNASYDDRFQQWALYWSPPKPILVSASRSFAQGPAWEALVQMDTRILPFVVAELGQGHLLFGCQLCARTSLDSRLQADPDARVSSREMEQFWVMNWQARNILSLYCQQMREFDGHVPEWTAEQRRARLSSRAGAFTSGAGYEAIRAMGKPAVPLIMGRYAREQSGWWYELLFEIVSGRRSGLTIVNKMKLYDAWKQWFETPELEAPRVTESSRGQPCVTMAHINSAQAPITFVLSSGGS